MVWRDQAVVSNTCKTCWPRLRLGINQYTLFSIKSVQPAGMQMWWCIVCCHREVHRGARFEDRVMCREKGSLQDWFVWVFLILKALHVQQKAEHLTRWCHGWCFTKYSVLKSVCVLDVHRGVDNECLSWASCIALDWGWKRNIKQILSCAMCRMLMRLFFWVLG